MTTTARACVPLVIGLAILILHGGCRPTRAALPKAAVPGAEARHPNFRDRAAEAGLSFRWGHGGRSPLNILDTAGGGCGFIDYDGDGRLDIVLVGKTVALYHNEGSGRFRDVSAGSGLTVHGTLMGVAVGDFDNDGKPDLFITGYGVERLYRNAEGTGVFEDVTARSGIRARSPASWATSAGFADLDGDGRLDLVVCHYVLFTPKLREFCDYPATPSGRVRAACPPLYYEPQKTAVYRNRGSGRFEDVTARLPPGHGNSLGLAFADYDDDGRMDFYVANDGQPGDLYHNLGGWKFENVGARSGTAYTQDGRDQAGMGADWADYDGDGRLDLIVGTFQDEPRSLYHNEGGGLFTYASYLAGIGDLTKSRLAFGGGFIDYDNDGFPDLLFANGHVQDTIARMRPGVTYAQTLQLFHNDGNGAFSEVGNQAGEAFAKSIVGRAAAFGDYDNDGKLDALIVNLEGAPLLLHNETANSNHWVGIRLVTASGKRDAIGGRVVLEMVKGRSIAESQSCRSYLASCDPRVHFGLGAESRISRLKVRWPSGKSTVQTDVAADRYITISEKEAH